MELVSMYIVFLFYTGITYGEELPMAFFHFILFNICFLGS